MAERASHERSARSECSITICTCSCRNPYSIKSEVAKRLAQRTLKGQGYTVQITAKYANIELLGILYQQSKVLYHRWQCHTALRTLHCNLHRDCNITCDLAVITEQAGRRRMAYRNAGQYRVPVFFALCVCRRRRPEVATASLRLSPCPQAPALCPAHENHKYRCVQFAIVYDACKV